MNEPSTSYNKAQQRRGRIMAASIMLVVALPMVVAYIVYHTGMGMPTSTINKGDFLHPPQPVKRLALTTESGDEWRDEGELKHWRLLVPITADCDEACRQKLYVTRQVHVRLGKDAYRVERLVVLVDSQMNDTLHTFLEEEHPGVVVVHNAQADWQTLLADTNMVGTDPVADGHYYLMDQQGYLMMVYNPTHTGGELLKDIKRMLKLTYEDQ